MGWEGEIPTRAPIGFTVLQQQGLAARFGGSVMARQLEYVVLFTAAGTEPGDEGGESNIVLLAWEILNTASNQVISREQLYVCPTTEVNHDLPAGITADAVQSAATLPLVLKQFHAVVTKLAGGFCLLTCGPQAVRELVHPEAQRSKIQLENYFYHYLDLATEFSRAFPDAQQPPTLEGMGEFLGVDVGGSGPQYGLEELKLVSSMTQKLIAQGHRFGTPLEVQQDCDLTVSTDPSKVKENCVVRLRGLPFQASLKDVQGFLIGLNIVPGAITFGINAMGRRTGEATVVLESPEQADLALKRHKHYLKDRYIEVYEATPKDFQSLQVSAQVSQPDHAIFVRMQGLPYRASEADIVEFFSPEATTRDGEKGVYIVLFPDGRASGDAFAIFPSEKEVEKAMLKDRSNLGSRYVEIYKSSLKEFQMVLERSGTMEQKSHFSEMLGMNLDSTASDVEGMRGRDRNCVKLRGLPWSANADAVVDFFGDLRDDIVTGGVHIVLNSVNRPTGDCYVRMKSVAAAARASEQLHKQYIDERYIEVFQCSGDEVGQALMDRGGARGSAPFRSGTGGGRGGGGGGGGGGGRRRRPSGGATVKCRGLPYSTSETEVAEFFEDYDVRDSDVELIYNSSGQSTGIAYVSFQSRHLAQQAVRQKDRQHIGRRYVELSMN